MQHEELRLLFEGQTPLCGKSNNKELFFLRYVRSMWLRREDFSHSQDERESDGVCYSLHDRWLNSKSQGRIPHIPLLELSYAKNCRSCVWRSNKHLSVQEWQ